MTADADPVETARREGRSALTEAEAKRLLSAAGVATPEGEVVADAAAAVEAAGRIGYPVVAKVSAPAVTHKSDWAGGAGVALDLDSADAVRAATDRILRAAADRGLDARVLVEAAADTGSGTEVIVGATRDPSFGPTVLVGMGGVFAEVYGDTSHRLAPLPVGEARRAIGELRAATVLRGYRSRPAADLDALARVVRAVGDLVVEREAVAEVDVNPVLSSPDGAVALDATVGLADPGGTDAERR